MQSPEPIDFHEPDPSQEQGKDKVRPIEYGLVAVIAGAIGIMAVPDFKPVATDMAGMAQATQLQYKLDNYRGIFEMYRAEHRVYPGYAPQTRPEDRRAPVSDLYFRRQLLLGSSESGGASAFGRQYFPLGPYLETGFIKNPVNGLDTVLLLRNDQGFPDQPDGSTGWIFKPATGEIHANCAGELKVLGKTFYEM